MTWNKFKRIMPVVDVVAFGGIALIADVAVAIALFFPQEWPLAKWLTVSLCLLAFNGIFAVIFIQRWMHRPDFITRQGVGIWTGGIKEITKELIESALDFYVNQMVKLSSEAYFIFVFTRGDLMRMLNGASIEFQEKPITLLWPGAKDIKAYGVQFGKAAMVQWLGSISKSALFHELHHMVDEVVLGKQTDYEHTDAVWWSSVIKLNDEFGK